MHASYGRTGTITNRIVRGQVPRQGNAFAWWIRRRCDVHCWNCKIQQMLWHAKEYRAFLATDWLVEELVIRSGRYTEVLRHSKGEIPATLLWHFWML